MNLEKEDEAFPVRLSGVPSCGLTKLWTCAGLWNGISLVGVEVQKFAGSDGYFYEKRGAEGWFRVN